MEHNDEVMLVDVPQRKFDKILNRLSSKMEFFEHTTPDEHFTVYRITATERIIGVFATDPTRNIITKCKVSDKFL